MAKKKLRIGFIGQGYIGKNYADDFERRGYKVTRYSKERPYIKNKEEIKECDVIFIAVPTPTRHGSFYDGVLREVIPLAGRNKVVVIKSTVSPGLTRILQNKFKDRLIIHSPEFLSEDTAANDASNPFFNIVGIKKNSRKHKKAASLLLTILPPSPFFSIVSYEEAELIKYIHNSMAFTQIVFFNLMYDLALKFGADWANINRAIKADPLIPNRYSEPVHKSGRGAGGHCFIKDFAVISQAYEKAVKDPKGIDVLKSLEIKNIDLLRKSKKDLELLREIY